MQYNVYIATQLGRQNILEINDSQLEVVVNAYLEGDKSFTLAGKTYYLVGIDTIKIFTSKISKAEFLKVVAARGDFSTSRGKPVINPNVLSKVGDDVTSDFLGNNGYGSKKEIEAEAKPRKTESNDQFINSERILELQKLKNDNFDLSRLIQLLKELNHNYDYGNYFSVGMIGRTILNHIPPIFGFKNFKEVAANYGGKSFKGVAKSLHDNKHIAEDYLHQTIRKKEVLPNKQQVNFQDDLDFLLCEIIRNLS